MIEIMIARSDSRGGPLPVRCYKQHDDSYWVEFTPESIGMFVNQLTLLGRILYQWYCEGDDLKRNWKLGCIEVQRIE